MSTTAAEQTSSRQTRIPLIIGASGIGVILLLALGVFLFLNAQLARQDLPLSIEYTTESGRGSSEGVVNSPVKVNVRIPSADGSAESVLGSITVELFDEAGNPAQYGGQVPEPFPMKPTLDITRYEYAGSIPSEPGRYYARATVRSLYGDTEPQTYEVRTPVLQAVAEPGPPLRSGYVFASDLNLWMLSTDTARQRRLTYYPPQYEFAEAPVWSPDGTTIAYVYSPRVPDDQVPGTDIWTIGPDGNGARQLVAHVPNDSLYHPSWSSDGKFLYFTVETTVNEVGESGYFVAQTHRIARLDLQTGEQTAWAERAQMPHAAGPADKVVYLREFPPSDELKRYVTRYALVRASAQDSRGQALVDENAFWALHAPQMSPDGKWVVFAAVNDEQLPTEDSWLDWLLFKPRVARAHGAPWDLYLVPASGGEIKRLTFLDDDEPYPTWLDNDTIAFMSVHGLLTLDISGAGEAMGEPTKIHDGAQHSSLSWHGP